MQVDYVDLLFCHRPDADTPIEETVNISSDPTTLAGPFSPCQTKTSVKIGVEVSRTAFVACV